MRPRRVVAAGILFALSLSLSASRALAAESAEVAARTREGDEAMDQGRPAEALAAYEGAARIEPSPALDYNIGRARLGVGDFAGAILAFEHFLATAPEDLRDRA